MPTMVSLTLAELMIAEKDEPTPNLCAVAKLALTTTSLARPDSGSLPSRRNSAFTVGSPEGGSEITIPVAGSRIPSMSRIAASTIRVSTATTAVNRGHGQCQRLRGAHRRGEDVAEPIAFVVGRSCLLERAVSSDGQDKGGDAARHDQVRWRAPAPTCGQGRERASGRACASLTTSLRRARAASGCRLPC